MKNSQYSLDITSDICPITMVKTKLLIETMQVGEVANIRLNSGEPLRQLYPELCVIMDMKCLKLCKKGRTVLSITSWSKKARIDFRTGRNDVELIYQSFWQTASQKGLPSVSDRPSSPKVTTWSKLRIILQVSHPWIFSIFFKYKLGNRKLITLLKKLLSSGPHLGNPLDHEQAARYSHELDL